MNYEILYNENSILGECPIWDEKSQRLFWIDGLGKKVHIFDPVSGRNISYQIPQQVGSLALTDRDNILILALQDGIYTLDIDGGAIKQHLPIEENLPGNRFNDGKCDCMGRFWFGSMNTDANDGNDGCAATGSLYCLSANRKIKKVFSGVTISNGMGWDLENRQFYYIDSAQKAVFAFDFDLESGELGNRRVVVDLDKKADELPDGMAVDSGGMLWVAIWGGYRVCRFDPRNGSCLAQIILPVRNITSCAFGGKNLDELYVTSANIDSKGTEKELAGSLFRVKVQTGIKGGRNCRFILSIT